jgi:hypothetical protein
MSSHLLRQLHLDLGSAALAILLALTASAGAAARPSGDRALIRLLGNELRAVIAAGEAARSGRGADAAQAQYDLARDLQESLRALPPVSAGCRRLLAAAQRLAAGEIAEAEGVDRLDPSRVTAGRARVSAAQADLSRLPRACSGGDVLARPTSKPELGEPRSGEAFPGRVRAAAPAGATAADVVLDGRAAGQATLRTGQATVSLAGPFGRRDVQLRFRAGARLLSAAESRATWLLPRTASRLPRAARADRQLAAGLARLASGFRGQAGIWVEDLTTGASAGWNEDARFPAASTVKLAMLVAALRTYGPRPERSQVAYDLEALTGWSSNLAANRLLRTLGGSEARGSEIAETTLRRLGARSSSYTGDYGVGTAAGRARPAAGAPDPPPLVSRRVTTARDLGQILRVLHAAAMGDRAARSRAGLTEHEARVGLAYLLSSQPRGENLGLLRPSLARAPIAQKNGWLSDARHTAAVVYTEAGPKIVVLLTYRPGITRAEAAALGARLLKLVR